MGPSQTSDELSIHTFGEERFTDDSLLALGLYHNGRLAAGGHAALDAVRAAAAGAVRGEADESGGFGGGHGAGEPGGLRRAGAALRPRVSVLAAQHDRVLWLLELMSG